MRRQGAVTVYFSLIFMIMFSFILSFFEMAAYTARASYHASAGLLATENYFAAYLKPLYEQYHIFGREIPEGEEPDLWSEEKIAEDVKYMTQKREGEKSLLLRSGAAFEVTSATVLSEQRYEGFYSQAVAAMRYRGILEVVELLREFSGMTEQADAHMEIASAKAATDSAYAKVDEKILYLIELIDGVDIARYEQFLHGQGILFQKEVYVKYFCVNPSEAAEYFDRAEVYQAFLNNHKNPEETLASLSIRAEDLADAMEERENEETICRSRLAAIRGQLAVIAAELARIGEETEGLSARLDSLTRSIESLSSGEGNAEQIALLAEQASLTFASMERLQGQKEQYEEQQEEYEREIETLEDKQRELEEKKELQEEQARALMEEEEVFVNQCATICEICDEAYSYVGEIQEELERAQEVKSAYTQILDTLGSVVGDAEEEYRNDLDKYEFYEGVNGFDFERMKQTLLENKSGLWNIRRQILGITKRELRAAVPGLQRERTSVRHYTFEGLKIYYGETTSAEPLYEGIESMISREVATGFLGFLTQEALSEKTLDTAHLPSGFRDEEGGFDIFSLLGSDMSGIFEELRQLLPEDMSLGEIANGVTDTVLFHSYLATHYSDFLERNDAGALSYELEYLIAGKYTDKENLSSVAMRICGIRTILHFISLYTDSTRKGIVEQAALALCGAIGLPALKSVVVVLLLFVWALEEAVIDTAAMFLGKRVLLYPGRNGGSLTLPELLLFSKAYVSEKAAQKADARGLAFGYNEFLHLFLFLTPKEEKKYRAVDLIQENMRKWYSTSFRIGQCVWKLTYRIDGKEYVYAYES